MWLWLIAIGLVVVGGLLWLVVGRAPDSVTGRGMIVPTRGFVEVGTGEGGRVTEILVDPGDTVAADEVVARLVDGSGRPVSISAPVRGVIATVLVRQGSVAIGSPLMTIDPVDDGNVAVGFLPADQASRVEEGMEATVAIASAPQSEFGSISGTVVQVGVLPTTADRISLLVGGNSQLPAYFLEGGPVVEVTVLLKTDPATSTGYVWTIGYGPAAPVRTGTLADVTVILDNTSLLSRITR